MAKQENPVKKRVIRKSAGTAVLSAEKSLRLPEGHVDSIGPTHVVGWVWEPAAPTRRLSVSVEVNGSVRAELAAKSLRPDLARAGKGDGRYGFRISLPPGEWKESDLIVCRVAAAGFTIPIGRKARSSAQVSNATRPRADETDERSGRIPSPVFILGSPRSGTTLLASALRKAGLKGFNEGHLLNLFFPVRQAIERHFRLHHVREKGQLLSNINVDEFVGSILEVFEKYQTNLNPNEPWFDKTPDAAMITLAPAFGRLWPNAAFIFAKRRGIENIVSRLAKFPKTTFEEHCTSWADTMSAWREVRKSGINGIEIDQYDIAHDPADTGARLAAFLQLTLPATEKMIVEMRDARPQSTSADSTSRILSIENCGWNPQQVASFRAICSEEMATYGYTMDERYRSATR